MDPFELKSEIEGTEGWATSVATCDEAAANDLGRSRILKRIDASSAGYSAGDVFGDANFAERVLKLVPGFAYIDCASFQTSANCTLQ